MSGPETRLSRAFGLWASVGTAFVLAGLFAGLIATVAVPVFAVAVMGASPATLLFVPVGGFLIWFYASALLSR